MGFTLKVSGGKKAAQHIARLSSVPPLEVVAGYPSDLPPHPGALHRVIQEDGSTSLEIEGAGASIPTIAAKNEFGDGGLVPERAFMRPAFNANRGDYRRRAIRIVRSVIRQDGADPQDLAADLGAKMESDIKAQIDATTSPSNTEFTIWKKLDADHPLIDSGTMRESTTFRVRL